MTGLSKWKPTENMAALLRALREANYDISVTDACQAAGISRQAYYQWFETPEFRAWWEENLDRYFALRRGRVMGALARSAEGERVEGAADRKLFLERYDQGYAPRERKEVAVRGGLDFANMTTEQLKRLAHATRDDESDEGVSQ